MTSMPIALFSHTIAHPTILLFPSGHMSTTIQLTLDLLIIYSQHLIASNTTIQNTD